MQTAKPTCLASPATSLQATLRTTLTALLCGCLLSACGFKGPLYLVDGETNTSAVQITEAAEYERFSVGEELEDDDGVEDGIEAGIEDGFEGGFEDEDEPDDVVQGDEQGDGGES